MASKLEALQAKIEQKLQSGEFYEAEQLCRTMGFRLSAQKKFDEMFALFEHGIVALSQHSQVNAAADLADLVATEYSKHQVQISDTAIVRIATALAIESAIKFLLHCLKWSAKVGSNPEGEPRLHAALANCYIEKEEPALVHIHLARSGRVDAFAAYVRSYCTSLPTEERDLGLARAALHLLAAKRAEDVPALLSACADVCESSVLLSFVRMLAVSCVRQDGAVMFELLRSEYAPALQRDSALQQLLDRTSQLYYHTKPAGAGGLLQDLMSSLTGEAS